MINIEKHLTDVFPKSNPNAILCEVMATYELQISTWLGYEQHSQQEIAGMADLSYKVFEDVFASSKEDVYALVNHWDLRRDVYMLNQFEAYKNGEYHSRVSIDETQEEAREQFFIETTIADIRYKNILRTFVERDYDQSGGAVTSRVFFIHPQKQMYLLYFDSEIIIGSNSFSDINPFYHKYYEHIGIGRRKRFNEYSL